MHETPCETLVKCKTDTNERLDNIEKDIKAMREILETWNNTKGFVSTVRTMSKVVIFIAATGAALTGIYHYLKHFGQG